MGSAWIGLAWHFVFNAAYWWMFPICGGRSINRCGRSCGSVRTVFVAEEEEGTRIEGRNHVEINC
jgi:hypothetical protein